MSTGSQWRRKVKFLMLASLAATLSLSASADTLQKIAADDAARTTTVKSSKSNSSDREQALQGADTCEFAIDQKGVKRLAQPQKECKTFNESRSNTTRGAAPESKSGRNP